MQLQEPFFGGELEMFCFFLFRQNFFLRGQENTLFWGRRVGWKDVEDGSVENGGLEDDWLIVSFKRGPFSTEP